MGNVHDLPDSVTAADIERHLDGVAKAIVASEYGDAYMCLFEYLEGQLKRVKQADELRSRIAQRAR